MTITREKTIGINFQDSPLQCTYNYARFKLHPKNREIREEHIEKLKKSIKINNLLHTYPIIVTDGDFIFDGQHRYLAVKSLGIPMYFRLIPGLKILDVIPTNVNTLKWNMSDYLHYFVIDQKPSYLRLQRILDTHPNINLPLALRVLCDHKTAQMRFKKGDMELDDDEFLVTVLDKMDRTVTFLKEKMIKDKHILRTQVFMCGLSLFFKNQKVDLEKFLYKLEVNLEKIHQCVHYNAYIEQFKNIYNFGSKKNERIA